MRCPLLSLLLFLYVSFEGFVFLTLYYVYCGNPVVIAGLNHFALTIEAITAMEPQENIRSNATSKIHVLISAFAL